MLGAPASLLGPLLALAALVVSVSAVLDVAWWSSVAQLNTALSSSKTRPECRQLEGLSQGQARICELFKDHMPAVGHGTFQAIQSHRWNCSTPFDSGYIGPVHKLGTREAAFTYAILSAGVAHEIGRRCRLGELASCGCAKDAKPKEVAVDWTWGGCGDNVDYGYKFSRDFIDVREREEAGKRSSDLGRSLMNRWNNEAGRKNTRPKCKCHGVSGACNMKTCWSQLPSLREMGRLLHEKYEGAKRVQINQRGNLQFVGSSSSKQRRTAEGRKTRAIQLVFLDDSPDYCRGDRSLGTLGTEGRECRRGDDGRDGCEALCCGRGYNSYVRETETKCKCKFEWCCKVVCQKCLNQTQIHICK